MTVNNFFRETKKIGLTGPGVDFILVSLDFKGESLENVVEVTQHEQQNQLDALKSTYYIWYFEEVRISRIEL